MTDIKTTTARKVNIVRRSETPPAFCDFANVSAGTFGVKLVFGVVSNATEDSVDIEEHTRLGMTAEHAKALYSLLGEHLEAYERQVGPISLAQNADDEE